MSFKPIISSLLDTDFYKFTMGGYIHQYHPNTIVKFETHKRTLRFPLSEHIKEQDLRDQLDHARTLNFKKDELDYLEREGIPSSYTDYLESYKLPPYTLEKTMLGDWKVTTEGRWVETSLWETFTLSILNELFSRSFTRPTGVGEHRLHLVQTLIDEYDLPIVEFGTRRRYSQEWQEYIYRQCITPHTSNVYLSTLYGTEPKGTMAHELFMVAAALVDERPQYLVGSQNRVYERWDALYHNAENCVTLPDTYGSNAYTRNATSEHLSQWKGVRHDSGDPFLFTEKMLALYSHRGIPSFQKSIVYSDGLTLMRILELWLKYKDRIGMSFGWGTNLTNNVGIPTLSLVMKASSADGNPTVKLSDNPAKAMGPSNKIEFYKEAFGYNSRLPFEECLV